MPPLINFTVLVLPPRSNVPPIMVTSVPPEMALSWLIFSVAWSMARWS